MRALYDSLAALMLAQPDTFVATGSIALPPDKKGRRGKVDGDEAAYLERHKNLLKPSSRERAAAFVKFLYKLFRSTSLLIKILVLASLIFALLILLPALMGVFLTVANSMSELVRLGTICFIFVAGALMWAFAPI